MASARVKNPRVNGQINSLTDDNMPAPSTQHSECRSDRGLDDEPPAWAKELIHTITQSKGNGRPRSPSPAKVPANLRQPSPKPSDRGRKRDSFFFKGRFHCGSVVKITRGKNAKPSNKCSPMLPTTRVRTAKIGRLLKATKVPSTRQREVPQGQRR